MSWNQIALLLEIIGFLWASFFFAIRRVDRIKEFFDRRKATILRLEQQVFAEEKAWTQTDKRVRDLYLEALVVLLKIAKAQALIFYAMVRKRKAFKQLMRGGLRVTISGIRLVAILLSFALFRSFYPIVKFTVRKLAPADAVSTILIVLGSFLVLIGLTIEFIVSFN